MEGTEDFTLDTKGFCFNCYLKEDNEGESSEADAIGKVSLKVICQWFGLDLMKIFKKSGGTIPGGDEGEVMSTFGRAELAVWMCKDCKSDIEGLSGLLIEQDKVQKEIDKKLSAFHNRSNEGKRKEEWVAAYDKAMSKDLSGLFHSGFIDKLREEIIKKVTAKAVRFIQTTEANKRLGRLNTSGPSSGKRASSRSRSSSASLRDSPVEANKRTCRSNAFVRNSLPSPILTISSQSSSEERASSTSKSSSPPERKKRIPMKTLKTLFHVKISPTSTNYECRKCEKTFKNYSGAVDHFENFKHKVTREEKYVFHERSSMYKCTFKGCYQELKSAHSAVTHYNAIHLGIRLDCDICKQEGFYDKSTLNKHQKSNACIKPSSDSAGSSSEEEENMEGTPLAGSTSSEKEKEVEEEEKDVVVEEEGTPNENESQPGHSKSA